MQAWCDFTRQRADFVAQPMSMSHSSVPHSVKKLPHNHKVQRLLIMQQCQCSFVPPKSYTVPSVLKQKENSMSNFVQNVTSEKKNKTLVHYTSKTVALCALKHPTSYLDTRARLGKFFSWGALISPGWRRVWWCWADEEECDDSGRGVIPTFPYKRYAALTKHCWEARSTTNDLH